MVLLANSSQLASSTVVSMHDAQQENGAGDRRVAWNRESTKASENPADRDSMAHLSLSPRQHVM